MTHRIAVLGGDGIGPELVEQGLRVLDHVAGLEGFAYELEDFPHCADRYRRTGEVFDGDDLERMGSCDSLFHGARGVDDMPGVMERMIGHAIIQGLDLSIGVRPAYLHAGRLSPLKDLERGDVDCVIVRDTTEGELTIEGGSLQHGNPYEATASLVMHTRHGVERTLRYALEMARGRRRRLSLVVQSNALRAHRIWPETLERIAGEYPEVETELLYPDHAAMRVVTHPSDYDVIATTLMLGGILTDLVAATVGGIGLIGSSRFNPTTRFGMFEPAHGSAPRYTGQGRVSPMATLNALAMLLDNLGEGPAAARIRLGIDAALSSGVVPDLTTRCAVGTREATDAVIERLDG